MSRAVARERWLTDTPLNSLGRCSVTLVSREVADYKYNTPLNASETGVHAGSKRGQDSRPRVQKQYERTNDSR